MIKRIFSLILVLALMMSVPCYAASTETKIEEEETTEYVIDTYFLPRYSCRDVYYDFLNFSGSYSDLTSAVAHTLAASGYYGYSTATTIAVSLSQMYFSNVTSACCSGWQNGRGCTVYAYSNASPRIMVN